MYSVPIKVVCFVYCLSIWLRYIVGICINRMTFKFHNTCPLCLRPLRVTNVFYLSESSGTFCLQNPKITGAVTFGILRYSVYSREGLGPRVIPWQRQSGCQFVAYLAYIIGSKFEQHHLNIS